MDMHMSYLNHFQAQMLIVITVFSIPLIYIETNDQTKAMVGHIEDIGIHMSLSPGRLFNMQNDGTFCKAIKKFINEKKLSFSERCFVNARMTESSFRNL